MTDDKGILIKNIYYMLSYAFQVLKRSDFESVAAEEFDMVEDLFAAILAKGVAAQLKQGLYREYVTRHDTLSVMRGKLDMPQTIRCRVQRKQKLACEFDELSEDNLYNRIIKTTMHYLIKAYNVAAERKAALKKVLIFFDNVALLKPSDINWSRLYYRKSNRSYEMLLNICYFVLDGMLQTTENGDYKMANFTDEHMARLFERFILEYYRYHHKYLSEVKSAQVRWNLVGDNDENMIRFLPTMQTDIFLRLDEKVLILDAKYYGKTMQHQFDKYTLHSGHMYQIFAYVKNQDKANTGNVAGMLIYAKTQDDIAPDYMFNIGGNQIGARTLDLNRDFKSIAGQLNDIAEWYFGKHTIF